MTLVSLGQKGENDALIFNFLKGAKKMPYKHPYDYEKYGLKIDVKSAQKKDGCFNYRFKIKRKYHVADLYIFLGYESGELKHAYLMPASMCHLPDMSLPTRTPNEYESYRLK